jgi:hypothetical protein
MSVCNMSVCSPCIWLQSIEQPQALLLTSITRTVIRLFKVIDMCTPWSLETRPRSKILVKTLLVIMIRISQTGEIIVDNFVVVDD